MIKIKKVNCPIELTSKMQRELTEEYKKSKKSVWNKEYIKTALLQSSHNKCAYCECILNKESNYIEVEHYHHKNEYPDEVIEWDNLLPSCKRCNGNKGAFNTKLNPFVNPSTMNPKEHMILDLYRLRPISLAGENTIEELNLNDSSKVILMRYQLSEAINKLLENVYQNILDYKAKPTSRRLNKIASDTELILNEGLETSAYAGILSTLIKNSSTFRVIQHFLNNEDRWNEDLQKMYSELEQNALSIDYSLFKEYIFNPI
ncbi:HNH endonuclease [Bacillus cereus]|uniref:HNH endonuclease n=1 Tax=Bacillus cereus TaxID=1396 RepID=UPI000BF393FF|nr:HNH endonuclease [Bacillus cereus]MED2785683.1 HNH endonuclease [Bacillus thuringiensis]MED2810047.1 HNH endonuclease [Bacillus thuringiensis]MED2827189.1 HNH endonuclease [Bacillus thuringiensis]MED2832907.1 HNH endonuclease [Bacillus thuringiensis]MED2851097.1 HNH endonuclease [Bacillus thuringiensis]